MINSIRRAYEKEENVSKSIRTVFFQRIEIQIIVIVSKEYFYAKTKI